MPSGGQITIATANVIVDDPKSGNVDLAPGLYVVLVGERHRRRASPTR